MGSLRALGGLYMTVLLWHYMLIFEDTVCKYYFVTVWQYYLGTVRV